MAQQDRRVPILDIGETGSTLYSGWVISLAPRMPMASIWPIWPRMRSRTAASVCCLFANFTGALNNDLDTNNDGVFDVTPWTALVDTVAVNDGGAGDITYGAPALGVAYDGLPFAPGGASRIPDGTDTDTAADWVRNDFDLAGITTGTPTYGEAYNTPGALNQVVSAQAGNQRA